MDQKQELLSKVPLFAGLGPRDIAQVSRLADEVSVPAGKVLTKEGALAHEFFVILEGKVAVSKGSTYERDLGPGDFFGELALLARIPRSRTVTAAVPTRLLVVGHREFTSLLADQPQIRDRVMRGVARWIADLAPHQHN